MRYWAFMTATVVEADGHESNGWIDPTFSREVVFDSRNDVNPLDYFDTSHTNYETLDEWANGVVEGELGTAYNADGGGTVYGEDGHDNYRTGANFTYAIHFV